MPKPILYHCVGSRGLRALWAIEEMELDCELRMLPFPPRYQVPNYKALNPVGTVPTFVDGETVLTESCAILYYLATKSGNTELMIGPAELDYGPFLDFLFYADATLTFPQTVHIRFALAEPERGLQQAGSAYVDFFRGRLPKVERRLAGRDFLCANRFTAADIAVGYALLLSRMIGLGDLLSPEVSSYLDRLIARPSFIRASAREQQEAARQFSNTAAGT